MTYIRAVEVSEATGPEEADRLRRLGLDDRQVLETIVVAGFFRDYNLRVSIFGLQIEEP